MDQRKRIVHIVQANLPGSKVVFHDDTGFAKSGDQAKAMKVAEHFRWDDTDAEIISFTIIEASWRSLPRMCIVAKEEISDERLLKVIRMMS